MDFSFLPIELECPNCGFGIEILIKQVEAEEIILCLGCLEEIQLIDDGGSSRQMEKDLNGQLRGLLE